MHAYLITSGTLEERGTAIEKHISDLHVAATDIVYLDNESERVGIDSVREFEKRLMLKPYQSPAVAGVILGAQRLTTEAQNALLKVLEEPPPHVVFFVETPSSDLLLPTVVSRLTLLTGETPIASMAIDEQYKKTIQDLLSNSPGKKLAIIETIVPDRVKAKTWVQTALITARAMMLQEIENNGRKDTIETMRNLIKNLLKAQGELELNINPKLVLDTVFLSL